MTQDKLTLEGIRENSEGSIGKAIDYAKSFMPQYPIRPKKPYLPTKHTAEEAKDYAIELQGYEIALEKFKEIECVYRENEREIDALIEEYIKDEAGLYDVVPKQYQQKLYSYAYQQGHSGGFHEVYNYLVNLVSIFE